MTISIQPLFEPKQVPTGSAGVIFLAGGVTRIDKLTVTNPSLTVFAQVTLYWVAANGVPSTANSLPLNRGLQPLDAWDAWPFMGHVLAAGDAIWGFAAFGAPSIFGSGTVSA